MATGGAGLMERSPQFDTACPAVVLKVCRNAIQHGPLAVIRSLGRCGIAVYSRLEDRFTPAAHSRFSAGRVEWNSSSTRDALLDDLWRISDRLRRPAVLIATDDLASEFIAENATDLEDAFLFPRVAPELPPRLANKKELTALCSRLDIPTAKSFCPTSLEDAQGFGKQAAYPVVVKVAASQVLRRGLPSVSIVRNARELLTVYRAAAQLPQPDVLFQEYIPAECAEDWIFHGYINPETNCFVPFTGRKLRSYPTAAGPTTLGISRQNHDLIAQAEKLLRAVGYAGIVDIDFRLDRRDGKYKVLDVNPRVGANFRMFQSCAGVDVVRAMHLDLTGRAVPREEMIEGRAFIVEPYDLMAAAEFLRANALTIVRWWRSLRGEKELAWFSWDDPVPFFTMLARLSARFSERACELLWSRLCEVLRARGPEGRDAERPPEVTQQPAVNVANFGERA
jgi:predicted ATP-grasp superfamily ATP-dependent carboligase